MWMKNWSRDIDSKSGKCWGHPTVLPDLLSPQQEHSQQKRVKLGGKIESDVSMEHCSIRQLLARNYLMSTVEWKLRTPSIAGSAHNQIEFTSEGRNCAGEIHPHHAIISFLSRTSLSKTVNIYLLNFYLISFPRSHQVYQGFRTHDMSIEFRQ